MALDDVLQTHAADLFNRSGDLIGIAIHHVRQRHEGIPGKQDAILLHQHGDPIGAVAGGGHEGKIFLAHPQVEIAFVESQVRQDDLDLAEGLVLFPGILQGRGATLDQQLAT